MVFITKDIKKIIELKFNFYQSVGDNTMKQRKRSFGNSNDLTHEDVCDISDADKAHAGYLVEGGVTLEELKAHLGVK